MRFINSNIKMIGLMAVIIGSITSCKQEDELSINANGVKPNVVFVGLTNTNAVSTAGQLIRYNANNTNQIVGAAVSINPANLQTGESIVAIDYRPATGILYGVSNQSRLYILNPLNGNARVVNATPFTPAISGGIAGFDFNPTVDRIRLVTRSGQNLRLNPDDGTVVATDSPINGVADAIITEVAYTNNISGATTTEMFNLDVVNARLYKQDPNPGTLTTIGSIGLRPLLSTNPNFSTAYNTNITNFRAAPGGFDIAPTGEALAVFTNQNGAAPAIPVGGISINPNNPASAVNAVLGNPTLFQIDLATGKATDLGIIPLPAPNNGVAATALIGIATAPAPVAYAVNETNGLMIFNLTKPEPITKPITGLQTGENIVGLDMRPLTGQLFALGNSSRIYTINPASGAATQVGLLPLVPTLSGANFGFDFEPTTDLIRITSNLRQNLTVSPVTGLATANPALTPGNTTSSQITAIAYSNNLVPSTVGTTLFALNTTTDSLYRVTATTGVLTRVAKLNISADVSNGFDITTSANNANNTGNIAYAILSKGNETKIYTINLSSGTTTPIANFPSKVRAFTVGLGF